MKNHIYTQHKTKTPLNVHDVFSQQTIEKIFLASKFKNKNLKFNLFQDLCNFKKKTRLIYPL
jgi:hypothetical protein